jgi:hypothetical protein
MEFLVGASNLDFVKVSWKTDGDKEDREASNPAEVELATSLR